MNDVRSWRTTFSALMLVLCSTHLQAMQPLRALMLTSPGVYHNYEYQAKALADGIAKHANVRVDVSVAELQRWKTTDYSKGYDVLIYNICMADNRDEKLIANMLKQSQELGTPALVIHCSMHSFRETDLWWPLYGLQTKSHEQLGPMQQNQNRNHPILTQIPKGWTVAEDELYINLQFDADTLLSSEGADGKAHTTAWLKRQGEVMVFGTTLGHSNSTIEDPVYQRLLANALLFVTGSLQDNGQPREGLEPLEYSPSSENTVSIIGATEGAAFLGAGGQRCAFRKMGMAIGPCYLACILNPLEWGEETTACKQVCQLELPQTDELIKACE